MIKLKVNGEEKLSSADTLAAFLDGLKLPKAGVAVELNGEIIRRESYETAALKEGDVLEIVSLVGGG